MKKWRIESSTVGYMLIHTQKSGISLNWFESVKIDGVSIGLCDRDLLTTYYSKRILPEYIINELKKLPKMES